MGIVGLLINAFLGNTKKAPSLSNAYSTTQPKAKIFTTIKESHNNYLDVWKNNPSMINGMEFCATLQLRTPLRVLLRHGEIHSDLNSEPPKIAMEMWEGIWVPKPKTWRELGVDAKEFPESTIASHIGPILANDYLPFLIAIREVVELNDSIDNRISKLRKMLSVCEWQEYLNRHGGTEKIVQYFFPIFMNLPAGLETPNRIAAASDETLLGIKGIGPAKLKAIRARCASITENRDADRIENVIR